MLISTDAFAASVHCNFIGWELLRPANKIDQLQLCLQETREENEKLRNEIWSLQMDDKREHEVCHELATAILESQKEKKKK